MTDRIDLVRFQRAITTTANGTVVTGITAGANGSTSQLVLDSAGNVGIGATTGLDRLTVRTDQNSSTRVAVNNQDAGSSAESVIRLSAFGATWDVAAGSAARNTNALTFGISGTERMRIDASGRVTMPGQPMFVGELQARTNAANYVPTIAGTASNGISINGALGRITVPVAGRYFVSARQLINAVEGIYFHLRVNGTLRNYGYVPSRQEDMIVNDIVTLAANDYIDFFYQNNVVEAWTGAHSRVMAYLLG